MKIIFVNPPFIRLEGTAVEETIRGFVYHDNEEKIEPSGLYKGFLRRKSLMHSHPLRYGARAGSRWPFTMAHPTGYAPYPFFMGYAAAYLKKNGFEVNILDAVAEEEYDYFKFIESVKSENADIVVVECSTPTIDIDLWFAGKAANFAKVALAGPHLNGLIVKEIQEKNTKISYYLLGEYILNSLQMAKLQKEGVYPSEVVKDIDSIPFPFRDYKSATKYFDQSMPTPKPQLQIYGSKGCPFKCTFCLWPQTMYSGIVSLRKPEKIAEEINAAVEKHGYKSILFDDDTFNLGTERISKLCDYLKDISLPWTMMGRLDCSPDWLYDKMVDSGCVGMRFGIETFNIDILAKVQKGLERKDFRKTLEYISKKYPNLLIHLTMMKDMPGMTDEINKEDLMILRDLGYSGFNIYRSYQLSVCVPFPGTELYKEIKNTKGEEILKTYNIYDGGQGQETIMSKIKGELK